MAEAARSERKSVDPDTLRLFFALWPDDATRDALNRTGKWLHQHWGGRGMRADTLHLTLAFIGNTPAERLRSLMACAARVQSGAYTLVLDQVGYWHHNRVGWLGSSHVAPDHVNLVAALNRALAAEGFPIDQRPHIPHTTLLRNTAGGDIQACLPVSWKAQDFVLVKSVTESDGAHYKVLGRWPLE